MTQLLQLLGGGTGFTAISFFVLWITGTIHTKAEMADKDAQIAELKEALKLERARGDSVVQTGQIVRDVMTSLRKEL